MAPIRATPDGDTSDPAPMRHSGLVQSGPVADLPMRRGLAHLGPALVAAFSALFVFFIVVSSVVENGGVISNDASSYLAPAVAMIRGTGAPYVDYFDIKPPGLIFLFVPWLATAGWSMVSLVFLDALLIVGNLLLFWLVLRRIAPPGVRDAVYCASIAIVFGLGIFGGMILLSETIGSLLLLAALWIALRFRSRSAAFLAVGALCALAGQVKEVWIFSVVPFGVFTLADKASARRTLPALVAGWLGMTGLVVGGLIAIGALGAYVDVLRFKASLFPLPGIRSTAVATVQTMVQEDDAVLRIWPVLPATLALVVVFRARATGARLAVRELVGFGSSSLLLSVLLWASLVVGFVWQNKPLADHYFVSLYFPFMLVVAAALAYVCHGLAPSRASPGRLAAAALAVVLVLLPSGRAVTGLGDRGIEVAGVQQQLPFPALETPEQLAVYRAAASHLHGSDCLQVVYHWEAGAAYIYTGAGPCSRYFLASLLTTPATQEAYRRDLTSRPPAVIIYQAQAVEIDVAAFERTVFPYARVLAACYSTTDTPSVYVARFGAGEESGCIGTLLASSWAG